MKFLLTAAILLFSFSVFSQTESDFLPRNILKEVPTFLRTEWVTDSVYCYKSDNNSNDLVFDFRVYNQSVNDMGRVLVEVTQKYQNGRWSNYQRKNNTYNSDGSLISNVNQFFNPEGGGWTNTDMNEFTYNINGFLTKLENFTFSNNSWQRNFRNQYIYFNNVDPDEFSQQVFEGGFWRNKFQVFYSFDRNGNITSSLFRNWRTDINNWENNNRTFESYDEQNRPTKIIRETYDVAGRKWDNSTRTLWLYNAATNDPRIINEEWIVQDSTWLPADDIQLFFNDNQLETERIERNFEAGNYTNFFRSRNSYDDFENLKRVDNELFINGLWNLVSYCEFFYTNTLSSNEPEIFGSNSLCNINNPINSSTIIDCPILKEEVRLRIMNAEGKIVFDQLRSGQFSINKFFADGSYFFTFSKGNKLIETRKLIWKN